MTQFFMLSVKVSRSLGIYSRFCGTDTRKKRKSVGSLRGKCLCRPNVLEVRGWKDAEKEGCGEGRMRRKEQVPRAGVDLSQ